jgi:hypothetical protein
VYSLEQTNFIASDGNNRGVAKHCLNDRHRAGF